MERRVKPYPNFIGLIERYKMIYRMWPRVDYWWSYERIIAVVGVVAMMWLVCQDLLFVVRGKSAFLGGCRTRVQAVY